MIKSNVHSAVRYKNVWKWIKKWGIPEIGSVFILNGYPTPDAFNFSTKELSKNPRNFCNKKQEQTMVKKQCQVFAITRVRS